MFKELFIVKSLAKTQSTIYCFHLQHPDYHHPQNDLVGDSQFLAEEKSLFCWKEKTWSFSSEKQYQWFQQCYAG